MKKCDFQVVFERPLSSANQVWEGMSHGLCVAIKNGFSSLGLEPEASRINFRMNWNKNEMYRHGSRFELPVNFDKFDAIESDSNGKARHLWAQIVRALKLFKDDLNISEIDIESLDGFVISRGYGAIIIGKKQKNVDTKSEIRWALCEVHLYPEDSCLYLRCGGKFGEVASKVGAIGSNFFEWRRYFVELEFSGNRVLLVTKVWTGEHDEEVKFSLLV